MAAAPVLLLAMTLVGPRIPAAVRLAAITAIRAVLPGMPVVPGTPVVPGSRTPVMPVLVRLGMVATVAASPPWPASPSQPWARSCSPLPTSPSRSASSGRGTGCSPG